MGKIIKKAIICLNFLLLFQSCSSWNPKVVGKNDNGNYWIKQSSPSCDQWKIDFNEITDLSILLISSSKKNSQKCLQSGPDESFVNDEPKAEKIFSSLKSRYNEKIFDKVEFNKCFGSNSYDFFRKSIYDSLLEYHISVYNCSKEVNEIFSKSKSPDDFQKKVSLNLKKYFKKWEDIDF